MKKLTDNIAMKALHKCGLTRYGIEFGNWYGFVGIPLNYGLCSFVDIEDMNETDDHYAITARIKMPHLHTRIKYLTSRVEGGVVTEFRLQALNESLLGDIVIHSVFDHEEEEVTYNDCNLKKINKYIYSGNVHNELRIDGRIININMELEGCEHLDMTPAPYAAKLANNVTRYHSRAISLGGDHSSALLRTRGALSCFNLGNYKSLYDRHLYRVEKKAPKLLKNTQICSVVRLDKNKEILLKHKMIIL